MWRAGGSDRRNLSPLRITSKGQTIFKLSCKFKCVYKIQDTVIKYAYIGYFFNSSFLIGLKAIDLDVLKIREQLLNF